MTRAPFQVLVLLYRRRPDGTIEYAVFRRVDSGVWQAIAGGGENLETPDAAATRELLEESGLSTRRSLISLTSTGAIPVEEFADRRTWSPSLRTVPEYSFAIDVGDRLIRLSSEHSAVQWLEFEIAEATLQWESNRVALRELDALLSNR